MERECHDAMEPCNKCKSTVVSGVIRVNRCGHSVIHSLSVLTLHSFYRLILVLCYFNVRLWSNDCVGWFLWINSLIDCAQVSDVCILVVTVPSSMSVSIRMQCVC